MIDIKIELCRTFKIANQENARLWMKDTLITSEMLMTKIDQSKLIKEGVKFAIELQQ
jgi:hypothetical protein